MKLLRFFIAENELFVGLIKYSATCDVRNEINKRRNSNQIIKTFPLTGDRKPYYPRRFPTGVWTVTGVEWTDDKEFAPCKIKTNAVRPVSIWEADAQYRGQTEEIQDDSCYYIHFSEPYKTTLGCIRLNSADDARKIGIEIESSIKSGEKILIEVMANKQ